MRTSRCCPPMRSRPSRMSACCRPFAGRERVMPRQRVLLSASPMTGSAGTSSTRRPFGSIIGVSAKLGRAGQAGDDNRIRVRDLAAHCARVLQANIRPLRTEDAGNAGCTLQPRSRVQSAQKNAHTSIQGSGGNPTFPAQWLYGLLRALLGDRAFLPPSLTNDSASLTPASGRRDHTTSPYASAPLVKSASASTASRRAFRDDREPPLLPCLLYTSPSPRDGLLSRMPSS